MMNLRKMRSSGFARKLLRIGIVGREPSKKADPTSRILLRVGSSSLRNDLAASRKGDTRDPHDESEVPTIFQPTVT